MKTEVLRILVALGLSAALNAPAAVRYVDINSASPAPPYTGWATAAANIQDAVEVAEAGDQILVTNGIYQSGGKTVAAAGTTTTNRVAVTKPLAIQSVNGPEFTVIQGYQVAGTTNGSSAIRCVYLTDGASLSGFTLTNGATMIGYGGGDGGGAWCQSTNAVITNYVLVGNSASYSGGGAYQGTRNNCTLTGNSAFVGGGANGGTLNNCTVTGNNAGDFLGEGGGTRFSKLNNCIVYFNFAPDPSVANFFGGSFSNSCTTPLPINGVGNITNAPLFVGQPAGNLRLQSNSPCINAGNNASVLGVTDLDGRPRIVGGTVDIGAYEFQPGVSGEFIGWLSQFGLATDGLADYLDSDTDLHNNWKEWIAGTVPTDALSALRLLSPTVSGAGITVTWHSVATRNYYLERSADLSSPSFFSLLQTNIPGQSGETSFTDTNALGVGPFFYRVGVQP